jgi:tRNA pseudouridine55 synthase
MDFEEGEVILIDKPLGWTSFDVVNKLRFAIKVKKIGHAGTLDPLATGLLVLCTGKLTKKIDEYQAEKKEYIGTITLGKTTPSYDSETEPDAEFETNHIKPDLIEEATKKFVGQISQIPPMYSAIKIDGKRMYDLARKGKTVDIPSREVFIEIFEITNVNLPEVAFRVVCSKGTYIRTLANDFGKALNSGAYLSSLRRTKIGSFSVENAYTLADFIEKFQVKRENK